MAKGSHGWNHRDSFGAALNYEMLFDDFSRAARLLVSTVFCLGSLFFHEHVLLAAPVGERVPKLFLSLVELESQYYARSIKSSFPTTL